MDKTEKRTVSIDQAREISLNVGSHIHWRPKDLPEPQQYAIVYEEGDKKATAKLIERRLECSSPTTESATN